MIASVALALALSVPQDSLAPRRLDDFERITAWSARREGSTVHIHIEPGVHVPPGGLVVRAPLPGRRAVFVDAAEAVSDSAGGVVVRRVPIDIVFQY